MAHEFVVKIELVGSRHHRTKISVDEIPKSGLFMDFSRLTVAEADNIRFIITCGYCPDSLRFRVCGEEHAQF